MIPRFHHGERLTGQMKFATGTTCLSIEVFSRNVETLSECLLPFKASKQV